MLLGRRLHSAYQTYHEQHAIGPRRPVPSYARLPSHILPVSPRGPRVTVGNHNQRGKEVRTCWDIGLCWMELVNRRSFRYCIQRLDMDEDAQGSPGEDGRGAATTTLVM